MNAPSPFRPDRLTYLAAVGTLVGFWLALTPSLLPRPALLQGLVCAVAALLGYGIGALLSWIVTADEPRVSGRNRRIAWWSLLVVGVVGTLLALALHVKWQGEIRTAVGSDPLGVAHVTVLMVSGTLLFALFLMIARLIRSAGRFVVTRVSRVLPPRVAAAIGTVLVALAGYAILDNLVVERISARLDSVFMAINDEFSTDLPAPTSEHLSAGPGSLVAWEDLGQQGRLFIRSGPTPEMITEFSGEEALQPVRAYVGVGGDRKVDLAVEAELAVEELERTGGFERAVLNVATGTGRGWVNENQVQALEYMWGGDTATVSMQYSYLPSWMSFLVDQDRAQQAGRLLFDAVYARWEELPEAERPLLVVSGESLGSFGGEAAFSGAQDMSRRLSGALFVGPTGNNRLWNQFTNERDPGTPQVAPVYQGGRTVRFSDDGVTWPGSGAWEYPRVGYLQFANDPVTWWNLGLAGHRPDWLSEERGRDVHPQMRWIPGVTMLQVAVDQVVANDVPAGQGHEFGQLPVYAWAEILPPEGWTRADSDRLAEVIARRPLIEPEK